MDSNTLYVSWVLPQCCERAVQDHPTPAGLALLRAVQLAWRITRNCICLLLEDTKSLCDTLYSNYEWIQTNILSSKWFSWAALNSGLKNSLFTCSALFPSLLKSLILIYFFSCLYITLPNRTENLQKQNLMWLAPCSISRHLSTNSQIAKYLFDKCQP